jgi:ribonuclease HI
LNQIRAYDRYHSLSPCFRSHFFLPFVICAGNPGRAGSGSVIYKSDLISNDGNDGEKCMLSDSEEIWTGYHYLGEHVTNNVAEYSGLIEGLKQAVAMKITSLLIQGTQQSWSSI